MAVHCVAGLGRAPFLVAIALIHRGCERVYAIELIRKHRPGALNIKQANFLIEFKDKSEDKHNNADCACNIF